MEWYNCTCHCGGSMFYKHLHDPSCDLFVHGEEAPQSKEAHLQAALDAERAAKEAYQSTVVDLRKELATLQAQLEAVRRERDEAKLYLTQERANRDSLAACVDRDVQKIKDLQASLDTEREKYEKQCAGTKSKRERIQSLQQQIDAERTRREEVEMANYAKDGQIETLQADIAQLKALVREIKEAFDSQIHNCERCGADDPLNTFDIYRTVVEAATLDAAPNVPHEPGCPAICDDEGDQVLDDCGQCTCAVVPPKGGDGE